MSRFTPPLITPPDAALSRRLRCKVDALAKPAGALGRLEDLAVRIGAIQGRERPSVERFFTHAPDALHVGCQHFAAQGYDWLYLGEAIARGAAMIAAHRVSRALD